MAEGLYELDEEQRNVLPRIQKLLQLAGNNPNREEAARAAAKAQELMLAYNLSDGVVGSGDADGARAEEKLKGGFYEHERDLWARVADLNFCIHWIGRDWVERPEKDRKRKKVQERYSDFAQKYRKLTQHHLVGKKISVQATVMMTQYILHTIERLTKDFITGGLPVQDNGRVEGLSGALRSKRAMSFRRGVAREIETKLWDRRQDQIAEERKKKLAEDALRANTAGAGASTSTALTISSVRQTERDANMDFLYGEGWSAQQRQAREDRARAEREAEAEYTAWAAANPEEAAKEEAKRRKEERRRSQRQSNRPYREPKGRDEDWGAFNAGRSAGREVGLDPQAQDKRQARIGRS